MLQRLRSQRGTTIAAFGASTLAIIGATTFGIIYSLNDNNSDNSSSSTIPDYCNSSTELQQELGILAHIYQDEVTLELNADCLQGIERVELSTDQVHYHFNHSLLPNETFDIHLHYNMSAQECDFGLLYEPFMLHVDCNEVFPPGPTMPHKLGGSLFIPSSSPLYDVPFVGLIEGEEEMYVWGGTGHFEFSKPYFENDTYSVTFSNSSYYNVCKIVNGEGNFTDSDVLDVLIDCDHPCPPPSPKTRSKPKVGGFLDTNCSHVDIQLYQNGLLRETQHWNGSSFFEFEQEFEFGDDYMVVGSCDFDLCDLRNNTGLISDNNVTDVLVQCFKDQEREFELRIFHTISPKSHVYSFPVVVTLTSNFVIIESIALTPGQLYIANSTFLANDTFELFFQDPNHEEACQISQPTGVFINHSISIWVNCPIFLMPVEIEATVNEERRGQMTGIELEIESGNMLSELVLFIEQSDVETPSMNVWRILKSSYNMTFNLFGWMAITPLSYANRFNHFAWFDGTDYQVITNVDNRYALDNPIVPVTPVLDVVHVDCDGSHWVFNATGYSTMTTFFLYDDAFDDHMYTSFKINVMGEGVVNATFEPRSLKSGVNYWMRASHLGVDSQMSNMIASD